MIRLWLGGGNRNDDDDDDDDNDDDDDDDDDDNDDDNDGGDHHHSFISRRSISQKEFSRLSRHCCYSWLLTLITLEVSGTKTKNS